MQKAVEIQSRGLTLRGMLHVPEGVSGKVPMVCIFHGFTGNKMEPHFIFVKLSRMLERVGIASVRFDFGGSGESDGDFKDMTISRELEDAKAILDYVKALDFVDTEKIGVVGLSMGGAVASMLAGDRNADIRTLCLWAPAGNMEELVKRNRSKEDFRSLRETGVWDVDGLSLGADFLSDVEALDIYGKASNYGKNVLLLHGDKDESVPISASEQYLEIYGSRAVLHIVDGADHTFDSVKWESEVLDFTIEYLKGELE